MKGRLRFAMLMFVAYFACSSLMGKAVNLLANPTLEKRYAARHLPPIKYPDHDVRKAHRILPSFEGEKELPYSWQVLPHGDGQGLVSWEKTGDREEMRIQIKTGEKIRIRQKFIELTPKADYIATLNLSGKGEVLFSISVTGGFPPKRILNKKVTLTGETQKLDFPFKTGPHAQLACVDLFFPKPCDIKIGEVGLITETDVQVAKPFENAVLDKKMILFKESFEGSLKQVKGGTAKITDNGRTGRGVEVTSEGGGMVLALPGFELPEEGTIEFWYKPQSYPTHVWSTYPFFVSTQSEGHFKPGVGFEFKHWLGIVAFGVKTGKFSVDQVFNKQGIGWGWWEPDTWHHIAGSWDKEALRVYVDGVLEGIKTKPSTRLPHGKALDIILKGPGVIDEVIISKGLKYGPFVTKGAKKVAWNRKDPAKKVKVQKADTVKVTNEDLDKARKANIKPVPKTNADYEFGVDKANPTWKGMEGYQFQKDFYAKGTHRLTVKSKPAGNTAYWKLEDIEPGKYYVGVWIESQRFTRSIKTEYSPENLVLMAYLNGWPLRFETSSDPVQAKPGIWLCELQSKKAIDLKNGDEIAFAPASWMIRGQCPVSKLVLYKKEPKRGHGVTGQTWGADHGTLSRLKVLLFPSFTGTNDEGESQVANVLVANPLPCEVKVDVTWKMTNYFGDAVWNGTTRLTLAPHETTEFSHAFKPKGSDKGYSLDVKSKPVPGFKYPFQRPEEWLEFNDYTKMQYRPKMSGPLTSWNQNRMKLKTVKTGYRRQDFIDNANWERTWLKTRLVPKTVPKELEYTKAKLPYRGLKLPEKCFGTWNRKKFVVPENMKGQRILLRLAAVTEATVFVNGKCFGERIGQFMPMIYDVTSAIKDEGENELVICVRDAIALVRDDFAPKYSRTNLISVRENLNRTERWVKMGNVSLGQVGIFSEPKVGVRHALVLSDVGKELLKIMLRVRNSTAEEQEVKISFSIDQKGKKTDTEIPDINLTLKPWETLETSVKASGENLIPYEPGNPVFSALNVVVRDKKGKVEDEFRQRFGYRSYVVDGLSMNFNGKKAMFMGSSRQSAACFFDGGSDKLLERISYNEKRLEELDEWGQLHYEWVGIPFSKGWKVLNNPRYWKDYQDLAIDFLWRYGSHPCVAGLNISNESYHYASSSVGAEGQKKHAERIYSIAEAIEKAFDWKFWLMADGDADLDGKLDFCSFHYLNKQGCYSYKPGTLGGTSAGVNPYSPDCWFLNGAAEIPKKGTVILPHFKYGSKACADTESYWFMVNSPKNDREAISTANQFYTLKGRSWCWQSFEGFRDMQMAMIVSLNWESFFGTFQQFVWFSMPEQQVRYYSGRDFEKRINLHDDEYKVGNIKFTWSVEDLKGKVIEDGDIEEESDTMWIYRDEISFDVPEVEKRSEFKLKMKIEKDGQCYKNEERVLDVWPEPDFPLIKQNSSEAVAQALYDPKGIISPVLDKMGWKSKKIDKIDSESLKNIKRLVIGPDSVVKGMEKFQKTLLAFIEKGGRVLVLKQKDASILPMKTIIDKRGWISNAYVRTSGHPVMKGLTDRDFNMWQPKHLLAKGLYTKPPCGNTLSLLDASFALSTNWSPLLEMYAGTGSILACQLMLSETFEDEPMSAEMLKRMLNYLEEPVYKRVDSEFFVLNPISEKVIKRLNEERTEYEIINKIPAPLKSADKNKRSIVFIDLTVKGNAPDTVALRKFVESGGTVMLHRATPENKQWLAKLADQPLDVEIQPYKSWVDRQMLERRDGLLEGLGNMDFYWRTVMKDCTAIGRSQVAIAPKKERGQVQFLVKTAGTSEYLFPGGFSTLPIGKGEIIFDQLGWELPDERNIYYTYSVIPSKVLSGIMTNLGVVQTPPLPPISLPKDVKYETVDILNVANRGLKDDKGGDGIGWKDWGPSADLRTFPTGKLTFQGVPFHVPKGDKNAIVMPAGKKILPTMPKFPDRIAIPVNKSNVAGFWFLQAGGWTDSPVPFAHREIVYADGTKELIQLSSLNFADWNCGRDEFPDERETRTTVAWKGTTETWPLVRVYKQLWLNPHPEKEIKEVAISVEGQPEKNKRFVAHLGLTAAILPETQAKENAPERNAEKAQKLFLKAQKLQLAGKSKEALPLVKEALNADGLNVSAWGLLAEIRAKTDSVADFEELCRKWSAATPKCFQAWNLLGRFYESKKMIPQAIKAYRKSLEIEWNQPSILQSLEKLEKK